MHYFEHMVPSNALHNVLGCTCMQRCVCIVQVPHLHNCVYVIGLMIKEYAWPTYNFMTGVYVVHQFCFRQTEVLHRRLGVIMTSYR